MNKYTNSDRFGSQMTPEVSKQIPNNKCPLCGYSVGGNWCYRCAKDISNMLEEQETKRGCKMKDWILLIEDEAVRGAERRRFAEECRVCEIRQTRIDNERKFAEIERQKEVVRRIKAELRGDDNDERLR